tara:strand:+ start:3267 stop:3434 length:168 start_codon:yes stop_codon:yes gene_type:complete
VVIKQGQMHHFTANQEAKFVVADMQVLPENILNTKNLVLLLPAPHELSELYRNSS